MTKTYAPKQTTTRGHAVQINNMEMYYEEYGVGKPLVLLHGFGGCAQNWHSFTAKLSECHRLIVVDLRVAMVAPPIPRTRSHTGKRPVTYSPCVRLGGQTVLGYGNEFWRDDATAHGNEPTQVQEM